MEDDFDSTPIVSRVSFACILVIENLLGAATYY